MYTHVFSFDGFIILRFGKKCHRHFLQKEKLIKFLTAGFECAAQNFFLNKNPYLRFGYQKDQTSKILENNDSPAHRNA